MNVERSEHACMVDQETSTIYVMGGRNRKNSRLSSTEKLNVNDLNRKWEIASDLKQGLSEAAAVSSKSKEFIGYLVGGVINKNGAYIYVPTSKIWGLQRSTMRWIELLKRLETPRYLHTVVNVDPHEFPCN